MTATKIMILSSSKPSEKDLYAISGTSYNPEGKIENYNENISKILSLVNQCVSLNNQSKLVSEDKAKFSIIGTPTEGALRVMVEKFSKYDTEFSNASKKSSTAQPYNDFISENFEIVYTLEFDRKRKSKSVIAVDKKTNKPVILIKGAVEYLIKKAKAIQTVEGSFDLDDLSKSHITEFITENFMKNSLRTLALCVKTDISMLGGIDVRDTKALNNFFKDYNNILEFESNSTIISIVGMLDPPRPEVKDAIHICHKAGIRVIMITGDERETAKSIGVNIGLIEKEHANESTFVALEFFKKNEEEQLEILKNKPKLIFSRSEPEHKMELIKLLQKQNHIVAMTGDGTNDAPALSNSNIGIAMGISGTEVTKSAAHMILADDNFATIVKAVEEGRSIYMNMKAFIRYLISSNIGEVVSIFISSMFGLPEAFTSIQLLWVNLVTDGPPATALSFNPSEKDIMKKPPRGK
jgi:Ca2+-transporting ATPase